MPHSTTGRSPSELQMGRRLRTRLDLLHPALDRTVHLRQLRQKLQADNHCQEERLFNSDKVNIKNWPHIRPSWLPAVIISLTELGTFVYETLEGRRFWRHVEDIRSRGCSYEDDDTSRDTSDDFSLSSGNSRRPLVDSEGTQGMDGERKPTRREKKMQTQS